MLRFRIPGLGRGVSLALMTVVILLATANHVQAQTIRLGPKAGANLAWFSGSDWKDQMADYDDSFPDISVSNAVNPGFFVGGFLEIGLRPTLAVQMELLIGTLSGGRTIEELIPPVRGKASQQATVLTMPLLLKPKLEVGASGAIYGLIGPEPGVILGDVRRKVREEIIFTFDTGAVTPDNRFVLAATIGSGYERRVGNGAWNAEIRYSRTFTSIFDENTTSSFLGYGNTRINSINFFVGYAFDLGTQHFRDGGQVVWG